MKLKILHIVNWYPSKPTPLKAPWIKNQIDSLGKSAQNMIYHIEVIRGKIGFFIGKNKNNSNYFVLRFPFEIWKINEILSFLFVLYVIIKNYKANLDLINFHIAYPNCTYLHLIKRWIKCPIVITEHWSEYHYNFHVDNVNKRKPIQRIFCQDIPVIAVSISLAEDIKAFSNGIFKSYIVPNVVDTELFNTKNKKFDNNGTFFFMISQWEFPKDPFTVIMAWEIIIKKYPEIVLEIAGYGSQMTRINRMISDLGLSNNIKLIGALSPKETADKMKNASAFIHCSGYETFSVVCAESICSGTPVIASNVGGIPEYINLKNGILINENNETSFAKAVSDIVAKNVVFDSISISKNAKSLFSKDKIGKLYYETLSDICLK